MASSNNEVLKRADTRPTGGRLVVLDSAVASQQIAASGLIEDANKFFFIEFPAMPEAIELARRANYTVLTNMVVPDGVHQYKGTDPLVIPIQFELHAFDQEYCPNGALSLLRVAARLHALVLPLGSNESFQIDVGVPDRPPTPQQQTQAANGASKQFALAEGSGAEGSVSDRSEIAQNPGFSSLKQDTISPPVTCRLELMFVDGNSPGIVCTGYVQDVRVNLKGPFMKGPESSFNLPTSAEFSFNFMHRPGHGNNFTIKTTNFGRQAQAHADIVRRRFYNTRDLSTNQGYRGFSSD